MAATRSPASLLPTCVQFRRAKSYRVHRVLGQVVAQFHSGYSRKQLSRLSRCPLLVKWQASVSRGESTDKGQRGAAVYRWNPALNRWTEYHAVLLTPLWPAKPDFHAALPPQVARFDAYFVLSICRPSAVCHEGRSLYNNFVTNN